MTSSPIHRNTIKCSNCSAVMEHRYNTSCAVAFHDKIKTRMPIVLGVAIGLTVIALAASLAAHKARKILIDVPTSYM